VKNADEGVKVNEEVMKSLTDINTQSNRVSEVIAEIAAASIQQSQGIDQVNKGVSQMDQVTQQNAANSEESASASQELASQASEMKRMVDSFILDIDGRGYDSRNRSMPVTTAHHSDHARVPSGSKKVKVLTGGAATSKKPSAVIPLDDDERLAQAF
jgi:uncharacterized phage infection (PIP) family protein YhgE